MEEERPKSAVERIEKKVKPSTYAKAGVDTRKEDLAIKGIISAMERTFKHREGKHGEVMACIGSFANFISFGDYALALCTDGVGSKVLVAQEIEKYDTIGQDVIAMNVNDLICCGAEPIAFVDYLAMAAVNHDLAKEISSGMVEGARQAGVAVVGGETATLPDIIKGVKDRGFDLAGAALGIVKKEDIVTGEKVAVGDKIIGLKSSGIHSNGLTLARKVLPPTMWLKLLDPTRIYVKEAAAILQEFDVHGMANITGGGMLNLLRVSNHGFRLDNLPEPQMVFKKIQELGKVDDKEMYKTFNMGIGFCIIVSPEDADKIVEKYEREYELSIIGSVIPDHRVELVKDGEAYVLE